MKEFRYIFFICLISGTVNFSAYAQAAGPDKDDGTEVIKLENGDRISGQVIERTEEGVRIKCEALGEIFIAAEFIKPEPEKKIWSGKVSGAYSKHNGNTEKSLLQGSVEIKRKTELDEYDIKADGLYSHTDHRLDAQNSSGKIRYAYSFGKEYRAYNFYSIEASHNKFAAISHRISPLFGAGYWWAAEDKKDNFSFSTEIGAGIDRVEYSNETTDRTYAVITPKLSFEKNFKEMKFSQELTLYKSTENMQRYRFESETAIEVPLDEKFSLNFIFKDQYDSEAADTAGKNDASFVTKLGYKF